MQEPISTMTTALGVVTVATMILTILATLIGLGTAADTSRIGARDHHGTGLLHRTAIGMGIATVVDNLPFREQTLQDFRQDGIAFETSPPGVSHREGQRHCLIPRARGVAVSEPHDLAAPATPAARRGVAGDGGMIVETADVTATLITVTGHISVTNVVANEKEIGVATGSAAISEDGDHPRREGVGHLSVGISETVEIRL